MIFTSRTELSFDDEQTRLAFGEMVSAFLMEVVHHLPADIGFLISKGGITSNDVLSHGLSLAHRTCVGPDSAGLFGGTLPRGSPAVSTSAGGDLSRQCR